MDGSSGARPRLHSLSAGAASTEVGLDPRAHDMKGWSRQREDADTVFLIPMAVENFCLSPTGPSSMGLQ